MRTFVIGCNHRSAPVEVRERIVFDEADVPRALQTLTERFPDCEAVLLSTCNRTELYISRPLHGVPRIKEVIEFIADFHGIAAADFAKGLYHYEDAEAIRHLFRVASSLDSMVLGETQIANQAKVAYDTATSAGTIGRQLKSLFQRAFGVSKDIRTRTAIATGRLSVGSTAVDLARQIFSHFDDKRVMMVGAGKMGELTLTHLLDCQPKELLVANRTDSRAHELAQRLAQRYNVPTAPVPWEQWIDRLVDVDIVISCTGSREPILTAEHYKPIEPKRRYRPILLIDIAVPRDISPDIERFESVYLYNIDHLQEVVETTLASRRDAIRQCHGIIEEHVIDFVESQSRNEIGPTIATLRERFKAIGDAELERILPKLEQLSDHDRQLMAEMLHRVMQKLLHHPIKRLNEEARNGATSVYADTLRAMFNLEHEEEKSEPRPSGSGQPNPNRARE